MTLTASRRVAAEGTCESVPVGVVVPYDMAMDAELRRFSEDPQGREQLDMRFTRTRFEPLAVTAEQAREISRPELVTEAVQALAATGPAGYVYACTSGSFVRGPAGERRLTESMSSIGRESAAAAAAAVDAAGAPAGAGRAPAEAGPPAVTTSGALLQAVQSLGLKRIAVATPYDATISALFAQFFAESGIHVVSSSHLGLSGRIWTVPPETTYELIQRADSPDAEAVLVSCTNLGTSGVLDALEQDVGKPVISANQATVWATLRAFGLPYCGPGAALRTLTPAALEGAVPP